MKNHLADALVAIALSAFAIPSFGNAQTQKFSLRVRAYIDGSDYLYVRGNKVWFKHDSWDLPGKGGNHDDPTYLDDATWYPTWNGSGSGAESDHHTLPTSCGTLPSDAGTTVYLSNNSSRCEVSISAQPSDGNSYTLQIYLADSANGAEWCDFTLYLGKETIGNYTWSYSIDNRRATVTGISPGSGNISIPSSLGGCNVTSIGAWAFYDCSGLTSVTIPNSVTTIESAAFYGCSGLTSVTIPNSVTSIGDDAFSGCYSLKAFVVGKNNPQYSFVQGLLLSKDGKTLIYGINGNVTIPSSVTRIKWSAFSGYTGLTLVTIPTSVTSIDECAFYGCSGLTSITIPNSVTSIGYEAFSGCSGLMSVTIPNSVTSIGSYAFKNCSGLTSVMIPGQFKLSSVFPNSYQSITNAVVAAGSTSIAPSAFADSSCLLSVTIPDSVTSIGSSAFQGCSGLTEMRIPSSVTSIGADAFRSLNSTLFDTITKPGVQLIDGWAVGYESSLAGTLDLTGCRGIAGSAFSGCHDLTSVTIDNSILSIGDNAFLGCTDIMSVTIPGGFCMSSIFPASYKIITNAVVTAGSTSIGASAFSGCRGLLSVTIPDSVTSIGNYAFRDCSSLISIMIPDTVTNIGNYAFQNCSGLTSTTIPGRFCLSSIFPSSYKIITNAVVTVGSTSIGASAFSGCRGLLSVTIPDSVTSIGERAFQNCSSLKSIMIPDTVTSIGARAFCDCSGLLSMPILNSVTRIGDFAFYGCSGFTSVAIPNSVTSIGNYAFKYCSGLTSVTIPDTVTSIGSSAFSDCSRLLSVTIPGRFRMSSVFPASYQTMTNAVVTAGSTSIGASAFSGCSGLLSVSIPDSVTSIGESAFSDCNRLYDTNSIPGVRLVDGWAVGYEASLSGDLILTNCRGIGDSAFKNSGGWLKSMSESDANTIATPGLFQSKFNSRFNKTSSPSAAVEVALVSGVICAYQRVVSSPWTFQDPVTGASFTWNQSNTTFAYFGQMYMKAGRTYVFGTHFDDDAYVKVNGQVLIDVKSSDSGRVYTGSYACNATGWYDVEFRMSDGSGEKGSWANVWGADFGIGYRDDGLTDSDQSGWKRLIDPGDGSLLRCPHDIGPTSITIPDSVVSIGNNAFQGCADLHSVYLPVRFRGTTANLGLTSCCELFFYLPFDNLAIGSELVWLSPGDADWSEGEDSNRSFVRSGAIGSCATSSVETVVFGSGTLTFDWRISANRGDYYRVYLDGEVQKTITRSTAWATVSVSISSDGEHVVRWSYERGSASAAGDDAAFLANVDWHPLSLKSALDEPMLDWVTEGEAPWIPQLSVTADGIAAVRSGEVIGEGVSSLETRFTGPGHLSWTWRIDSSGNSGVDVLLDGEWLEAYEPSAEWSRATLEIPDVGEHVVRFEYWNAGIGDDILDCAFIDMVSWSESTQSSDVTVDGVTIPASWLTEKASPIVAAQGGNYESAARATAANGVNKVWECYVAGLNPTNAAEVFRAVISFKNGKPNVSWNPDLNEGGTKHERVYTVEGKANLTDSWAPTNSASRFFRVKVSMP